MKALTITSDFLTSQNDSVLKQVLNEMLDSSGSHCKSNDSNMEDYYIDYGDHGYANYIDVNYSDYTDH